MVLLVATAGSCGTDGRSLPEQSGGTVGSGQGDDRPVVLFLGTSLTAGYGLEAGQAYPALIQKMMDSAGYGLRAMNAGESGATSAGGVRRITWLMRQPVVVLVLELGANDGLRGYPPAATKENLGRIVDSARSVSPDLEILLAAMEAPPNLGGEYTTEFRRVFSDLAAEKGVSLMPFLLDGVAGIPDLNQPDGIHPTAEGQRLVALNVWGALSGVLAQLTPEPSAEGPS